MQKVFEFREPDEEGLFVAVNGTVITGMARQLCVALAAAYKDIDLDAPVRTETVEFLEKQQGFLDFLSDVEPEYKKGEAAMYDLGRIEGSPIDSDIYLGLIDLGDNVGISYLAETMIGDLVSGDAYTIAIVIPKEQQDAFFADLAEVYKD